MTVYVIFLRLPQKFEKMKKRKSSRIAKKTKPTLPTFATSHKSRLASASILMKFGHMFLAILVLTVAVWIYFPRHSWTARGGVGVFGSCELNNVRANMSLQVHNLDLYSVYLIIKDINASKCNDLRLVVPSETLSALQMVELANFDTKAKGMTRETIPIESISENLLETIIRPDLSRVGNNAAFQFQIEGVQARSFEDFAVLSGRSFEKAHAGEMDVPIALDSIQLASDFTITSLEPVSTASNGRVGGSIVFLGQSKFSEIVLEFRSMSRAWTKSVFDVFFGGSVFALIGSAFFIYRPKRPGS